MASDFISLPLANQEMPVGHEYLAGKYRLRLNSELALVLRSSTVVPCVALDEVALEIVDVNVGVLLDFSY